MWARKVPLVEVVTRNSPEMLRSLAQQNNQ